MKKLKLIYNPGSGNKSFKHELDPCIQAFQKAGYETSIFRCEKADDIAQHIGTLTPFAYDALVVSGGDGTINLAVNALMKQNIKVPLGIIPSGTANDFATFLKIPTDPAAAAEIIGRNHIMQTDVGMVNDQYFINVCAAGMFTNISQHIDPNFKNTFGKLAYYVKGLEQLPNFAPMPVTITTSTKTITDNLYFFFILNSAGTGGFERLSPGAAINDGLFDFVGFREMPIHELALLFVKVLTSDYLDDKNVIFFRDRAIDIKRLDNPTNRQLLETDIDGEAGPNMPIVVRSLPLAIEIFVP